jgi:TorA maturation chaperone TorD
VWRFISLGFASPSAALRCALQNGSEKLGLDTALQCLELPLFRQAAPCEEAFTTVFGHTLRAAICPYETEYHGSHVFQQAQELADLQGWYAAFGLERRPDVHERVDHIGFECEFAGFLLRKEAYFLESRDEAQAKRVRHAYRGFLRDHLGRFGMAVTTRLEQIDRGSFYGELASLCRRLLAAECDRVGVQPGPRALPLRPDGPDNVPAACGTGDECGPCEDSPDLLSINSER